MFSLFRAMSVQSAFTSAAPLRLTLSKQNNLETFSVPARQHRNITLTEVCVWVSVCKQGSEWRHERGRKRFGKMEMRKKKRGWFREARGEERKGSLSICVLGKTLDQPIINSRSRKKEILASPGENHPSRLFLFFKYEFWRNVRTCAHMSVLF